MNKLLYNLYSKKVDKLGRSRDMRHLGVFDDLVKLEAYKQSYTESNPETVFEVFTIEHLFLKQESE